MRSLEINLELDESRDVFIVRRTQGQMSGFFNKFNAYVYDRQADLVSEMLDCGYEVCAVEDRRFKSNYRIYLS